MDLSIKANNLFQKTRSLLKSFFIFGIGSSLQKLILFLFIPILTSNITATDYGYIETVITTLEILVPISTLNLESAIFRYSISSSNEQIEDLLLYSFKVSISGYLIFLIISIFLSIFVNLNYLIYIFALFFLISLKNLLTHYVRGINKNKLFVIVGIVNALTLVFVSLYFIYNNSFDVQSYLVSIILSNLISVLLVFTIIKKTFHIFIKSFINLGSISFKNKYLFYSLPLIPNNLAWWINSAAGRFIILFVFGLERVGVYSAAVKIPALIYFFASIFQQSWHYFSSVEISSKDSLITFNLINRIFSFGVFFLGSIAIVLSPYLSDFLFRNEFVDAIKYIPILILSSLLSILSIYYGGLYTAKFESKKLMISTLIGSIIGITLSIILAFWFDIYGVIIGSILGNLYILFHRMFETSSKHFSLLNFFVLIFHIFLLSLQTIIANVYGNFAFGTYILIFILLINLFLFLFQVLKPFKS